MMTRLEFLRSVGLAAATIPLIACKQDDGSELPAPDADTEMTGDASMSGGSDAASDAANDAPVQPTCNSTNIAVAANHGHAMTVPIADVTAAVDKTYQIQGTALHPHTVLLTAANFATLKMTGTVMVMSSLDAMHRHAITVTCAA